MPIHIVAIAVIVILSSTCAGCAGDPVSRPEWVAASDANIPAFDTFGWEGPADTAPVTLIDNQIRDAIRDRLLAKGYVETTDNADFLISHETIERDAIRKGNPVRIGIGVGSWGGNVGGSVGTSVDVGEKDQVVQQLQLLIRALDASAEREIWIGTSAVLPERPDADAIQRAVVDLLAGFPEKSVNSTP
jgi:hypothetical protein